MSQPSQTAEAPRMPMVDPMSTVEENTAAASRFPGLEAEYVKAELHNGIVVFADIREFTSYMDANSDYAISLLACFRRVLSPCFSGRSLKANKKTHYTTFPKKPCRAALIIWYLG